MPHRVSGGTHDRREDSASDQAHHHQARHLVLAGRQGVERVRQAQREHVRVTEADQRDRQIEQPLRRVRGDGGEHGEARDGQHHDRAADAQRGLVVHLLQHDAAQSRADGTEREVDGGRSRRGGERDGGVLHQDARRLRVDADIDAHVRDDAEEAQQHNRVAE